MGYFKQQQIKCEDAQSHDAESHYKEWFDKNHDDLYREWTDLVNGTHTTVVDEIFGERADGPSFDEYIDSCYEQYCYPTSNKIPG